MNAWEIELQRFTEFGREPTRERYLAQFDPQATLRHPGMTEPAHLDKIAEFIDQSLALWPEYHHTPVYWAVNGETLFVETSNSAVVNGRRLDWSAANVITLHGDHVFRGRSYYDRAAVFAQIDPAPDARPNAHVSLLAGAAAQGASPSDDEAYKRKVYEDFVLPYVENWKRPDPKRFKAFYAPDARMINPGFERPISPDELEAFYVAQEAENPGLQLRLETFAIAPDLVFFEWTAWRDVAGQRFEFPVVDRFRLRDMCAVDAVAYYDLMELAALRQSLMALEPQ
jgi:hypothetical protein